VRVLVTGITGFAGGHLAERLTKQGDEIFGVARSSGANLKHLNTSIELIAADLQQFEVVEAILARVQPEAIYHLAGQAFVPKAWSDPWATLENNLRPQLNILQAMVKQGSSARLLAIASDQIYGAVPPDKLPINEETPLRPNNPYGVSKVAQDMLGLQYYLSHRLNVIRARTFNHIGPRQSPFFVSANFAKQIAQIEAKQADPVIYVGNLEAQRDFTNAADVAQAYSLLVRQGEAGEAYNVGSGQAYSIHYLLEVLLKYSHCEIEIKQDPNRMRPSDVAITYADNGKLKAQTGWTPQYTFEESLLQVLNYWREVVTKNSKD